jgi:hypothetical protein
MKRKPLFNREDRCRAEGGEDGSGGVRPDPAGREFRADLLPPEETVGGGLQSDQVHELGELVPVCINVSRLSRMGCCCS